MHFFKYQPGNDYIYVCKYINVNGINKSIYIYIYIYIVIDILRSRGVEGWVGGAGPHNNKRENVCYLYLVRVPTSTNAYIAYM